MPKIEHFPELLQKSIRETIPENAPTLNSMTILQLGLKSTVNDILTHQYYLRVLYSQ